MKKQNLINVSLVLLLICQTLSSCKKEDNVKDEVTALAKSGQLSCKIDGKVYNHNGTGYVLEDNHSAVKAENGEEQFSISFYGMHEGDYVVSGGERANGKAKLSYYYTGETGREVYVSQSGSFKISKYQTAGGFKVSGTFSGKFEKFINQDKPTGITIEVTDGSFTDIQLFDAR